MKHITRIGILKKSCKPNEQKTDITFTAMMVNPKTHDSFCEPTSPCFLVNNQIREAADDGTTRCFNLPVIECGGY
jgi:hypothetical protein